MENIFSDIECGKYTGNLTPSKNDIAITRQLESAGETLGIRLIDHIIFGRKGYYSFKENNKLE